MIMVIMMMMLMKMIEEDAYDEVGGDDETYC